MKEMNVVEYLNNNNIEWFPIKVLMKDNNDGRGVQKTLVLFDNDDLKRGAISYKQAFTEFANKSPEEIKKRHSNLEYFDTIAIDTTEVAQIDVDTTDHKEKVKSLTDNYPYFKSVGKGLPHIFMKMENPPTCSRFQTKYEGIEVLTKQWSYCNKNAIVLNAENDIPNISYDAIRAEPTKKEQIECNNTYVVNEQTVDIDEMLTHIRQCDCDVYDPWWKIGNALFNSGYDESVFHTFSKRYNKYQYDEVTKEWEKIVNNPMKRIGFGSLMYHVGLNRNPTAVEYLKGLRVSTKPPDVEASDFITELYVTGQLTNEMVAKVFSREYGEQYEYCEKNWYALTEGGIIEMVSEGEIYIGKTMLKIIETHIEDALAITTDQEKRKMLSNARVKIQGHQFLNQCISMVKIKLNHPDLKDVLNKNLNLMGFKNGILNLETGEFRKGVKADMISLSTGYDYSEIVNEESIKYIEGVIDSIHPNEEVRHFVKKHLGSMIAGGNKSEVGFFWVGKGRNGKGTYDTMLMKILGEYYNSQASGHFTTVNRASAPEPDILKMEDKRVCMTHETEGNIKYLSSKFKQVTGNDPLKGRLLQSNIIRHFIPSHKTIIQTNHLPEFTDVDAGLLARFLVIRFPLKFCDATEYNEKNPTHRRMDVELKTKLNACSGSDMFHVFYKLYKMYMKEGLTNVPKTIQDDINSYRKKTDTVKTFLDEALEETDEPKSNIGTQDLLEQHNHHMEVVLTIKEFAKRLEINDIVTKRVFVDGKRVTGFSGYKFRESFLNDNKEEQDTD
jgi:P4 family phage/plasmid primase-like protien